MCIEKKLILPMKSTDFGADSITAQNKAKNRNTRTNFMIQNLISK